MRLKDTVSMFSTETFIDVFDSSTSFIGKVNPFAEVSNSGVSSQRRILETPVSEIIPPGRVIVSPSEETYIVADINHDYWHGEVIRHKYPILPVDLMGAAGDIGTTLSAAQPDLQVYAFPYFVRREINEVERSDFLSGYEIHFSKVKSFLRGDIIQLNNDFYRLKTDTWLDGAGFSVAQAVKIENAVQSFDLSTSRNVYDSVTDSYGGTATSGADCFVEELEQDYEFVTVSFTGVEAGDKAISVLKTDATMTVNDLIGSHRVLGIRDFADYVTCQCRKES